MSPGRRCATAGIGADMPPPRHPSRRVARSPVRNGGDPRRHAAPAASLPACRPSGPAARPAAGRRARPRVVPAAGPCPRPVEKCGPDAAEATFSDGSRRARGRAGAAATARPDRDRPRLSRATVTPLGLDGGGGFRRSPRARAPRARAPCARPRVVLAADPCPRPVENCGPDAAELTFSDGSRRAGRAGAPATAGSARDRPRLSRPTVTQWVSTGEVGFGEAPAPAAPRAPPSAPQRPPAPAAPAP